MDIIEATEWLNGERSMTNTLPQDPFETWQVRVAQADAAMTQQAYWIVKAHKEFKEGGRNMFKDCWEERFNELAKFNSESDKTKFADWYILKMDILQTYYNNLYKSANEETMKDVKEDEDISYDDRLKRMHCAINSIITDINLIKDAALDICADYAEKRMKEKLKEIK